MRSPPAPPWSTLPAWVGRAIGICLAVLVFAATIWVVAETVFSVPLLVYAVVASLLITAMLEPAVGLLHRSGVYRGAAALLTELLLLGAILGVLYLVVRRALQQFNDLQGTVNRALADLHDVLVAPPFGLPDQTATELRRTLVDFVSGLTPSPSVAAGVVVDIATGIAIAAFVAFFLLKDGPSMWRWAVGWAAPHRQERGQELGHAMWATLTGYVRGLVVVAFVDAVAIGGALFAVGVPLALSLSLIVFLGAFVPILGATVSGGLAVLVTAVTVGIPQALVVLVVVLLVQQVESNLLAPLIMGRAVNLHPVVVLLAVTAGALAAGIGGAVIAVPLVAVAYTVANQTLRRPSTGPSADEASTDGPEQD